MDILFIGKRFYTNRDAFEEDYGRIFQLPFWWAAGGHDVKLWLVDYHSRQPGSRNAGDLQVESTPVFGWRCVRRVFSEFTRPLRGTARPRLVIASGDCYLGLLGYLVARILGARFVFDLYDRYDVFAGYRRLPGFDPQLFLLRHADAVTFASNPLKDDLEREAMVALVVPNGVDTRHFRPMSQAEARDNLGLPAVGELIGYFGSMEPERGIDDLVAAVAAMREEGSDTRLVVGGHVSDAADLDRPWVHYLGNLEFSRMPAALAACDVLTLPYRHSTFLDNAASVKIAEYIAADRPIVATRTPNFIQNFPQQAAELDGLIAVPGDVTDLARCLRRQLDERRRVSMPSGMDWSTISDELLGALKGHLELTVN